MERQNHSLARPRKQEIYVALLGGILVLASALDPGRAFLGPALERGLLLFGVVCLGWAGWRTISRRPDADESDRGVLGDSFFAEHKRTLLVGLFTVHVFATFFFFPPGDIVNERPVVSLDHTFHYYQAWRAHEILLESGRLHGYDPFFMAGFPSALFDLDVKSLETFCALAPASQVARMMKIYILLCYLSMVFTIYAGCRFMRMTERESILAVALLLVFWHWGRPYASHFRYAGMFDFICVSHLAVLVVGAFHRFLEGRGMVWWLVLGPLACFVHPTAIVILVAPYVCLVVVNRRSITLKTVLIFLLWCVIVIAVNSIWLVPLFEYASVKTATRAFFQTTGVEGLSRVLFRPGCLPAIVLMLLAVPGAWRLAKKGRGAEAGTLFSSFAVLVFIAAYGVLLPGINQLEPGRFLLTAVFFSVPLAGAGAASAIDGWDRIARGAKGRRAVESAALLVLVLSPIVFSYLSARTGYRHRLRTTLTAEVRDLVSAVEHHVDRTGRLMIEDGPAALYGDSHLPGLLPVYTGVEQIGGPYPFTFLKHHFATFERDRTMGKPMSEVTPAEFWAYVDLYNVRWIAVASDEAKDFVRGVAADTTSVPKSWRVDGSTPLDVLWQSKHYTLWRVDHSPTFTGTEGDRVTATFNRIQIDLGAEQESFLLRYHWDSGLKANAPVRITPVHGLDDPVPFMLIEPNGVRSVVIRY
jgi:hypothetical protein